MAHLLGPDERQECRWHGENQPGEAEGQGRVRPSITSPGQHGLAVRAESPFSRSQGDFLVDVSTKAAGQKGGGGTHGAKR